MFKKIFMLTVLLLSTCFTASAGAAPNLSAWAHVQDYGNLNSVSGSRITIGTTGECKRMEAFSVNTDNPNLGISYCGHVEDLGWQSPVENGQLSGTTGQCKRIECFKLNLTGSESSQYDLYYRAHVENYGWLDWACNGASAGTSQHAFRCEALEIAIVPQGSGAPDGGSTRVPAVEAFDRQEGENMYLTNRLRKSLGKTYLTGNARLHDVAEHRVLELGHFSHTRPDGRDCTTLMQDLYPDCSYSFLCENIGCHSELPQNSCHHYFDSWCHNNTGVSENLSGHHGSHSHHDQNENCHSNMTGDYRYLAYAEANNIGGPYVSYGIQCFGN